MNMKIKCYTGEVASDKHITTTNKFTIVATGDLTRNGIIIAV